MPLSAAALTAAAVLTAAASVEAGISTGFMFARDVAAAVMNRSAAEVAQAAGRAGQAPQASPGSATGPTMRGV